MKITNKTKNTCLAENAVIAASLFKRMRGLLGRDGLKVGEALVLKPCNSVHSFFMRFTIDVVFVNGHNCVVKTLSSLRPFRLSGIYFFSSFAVELPAGTILATSTEKGDLLAFIA
ncbi:MAG: DUF192 domain-containing protein [Candidatus Omnitrophica bacterium]|nr:DUF192 domain-containing protein [Candidatus Omnitrophota bacterium]